MSTPASVIAQLQSDLLLANNATGFTDATVHDAITRMLSLLSSSGAKINQHSFACGSFTLSSSRMTDLIISHGLEAVPSCAFLWSVDAPLTTRGIIGKIRFHANDYVKSVALTAANGGLSTVNGSSNAVGRLQWTDTTLILSANSTYPLLPGITYEWLAIA